MIAEKIFTVEAVADAACITWLRDVTPQQALTIFRGREPFQLRTIGELAFAVSEKLGVDYSRDISGALALVLSDSWSVVIEPNGFFGTVAGKLLQISKGTEAISVFWNVNGLAEIAVAKDEKAIAVVNDVVMFLPGDEEGPFCGIKDVYGSDPSAVNDLVSASAKVKNYEWSSIAFEWVSKFAGVAFPVHYLDEAHLTAIIEGGHQIRGGNITTSGSD